MSCVRTNKIRKQNKKCARNAINARKLRKQKQKYASASRATDASGHCVRFFTQRTQLRQPIGMLDRSSQSWLPAQALALLAFFVYAMHATHARSCVIKKIRKQNKKCARKAINARKLRNQKQKYASESRATDTIGHCVRKRNARTDSIFPATNASASQ